MQNEIKKISFSGITNNISFVIVSAGMVEIEKSFKIEIEIYRIEIFRTEIEIGFY